MINGIINIYKEKGFTSHDVVAKLRGILKQKKIGHTGTLDPNAEGVLPVCIGKATKLCDLLTDKDKSYRAVLILGLKTDTQDTTGQILSKNEVNISEKQAEKTILSFVGEYDQIPPMYSALKVNGRKLYDLAREGKQVERKPRRVKIESIQINKIELPKVEFTVHCSKGTYIRTLCEDIGEKLGCGGCMDDLTRIRVERFTIQDALTLSRVEELVGNDDLQSYIIPIDRMFEEFPKAEVAKEFCKLLYNGNTLKKEHFNRISNENPDNLIRIYDDNKIFIALYKFDKMNQVFKNVKMFN
jgi:tRNA pseudouridine55 synthase